MLIQAGLEGWQAEPAASERSLNRGSTLKDAYASVADKLVFSIAGSTVQVSWRLISPSHSNSLQTSKKYFSGMNWLRMTASGIVRRQLRLWPRGETVFPLHFRQPFEYLRIQV